MPERNKALRRIARACGVATSYLNYEGARIDTPDETLARLIELLCGVMPAIDDLRADHIERGLPAVTVAWDGKPPPLWLWTHGDSRQFSVTLQSGDDTRTHVLKPAGEIRRRGFRRIRLDWPEAIPFGYHTLRVTTADGEKTGFLISAPRRLKAPDKVWGAFAPAYALRSARTEGIGGYTELQDAAEFVREQGGAFLGTLPLLPVFYGPGSDNSPYSPVSRLFWNEIFLDTGAAIPATGDFVDYDEVYAQKKQSLQAAADHFFADHPDGDADFQSWRAATPHLDDYAAFHAARADDAAAARRYHLYCQYQCHRQLAALKDKAAAGQCAELYFDYPVGVHGAGFDAMRFPHLFLRHAQAGAPPDLFYSAGQGWGFQPPHPQAMVADRFAYFRATLHHFFRAARMLRIDHIMGLYRLYCIPDGAGPAQGGYIYYPFQALLAVLCLEAWRHDGVLVGENLGTVPAAVNEALTEHGIHRMWVCQFEMKDDPARTFDSIESDMLASLNTHDMFPFRAFLDGDDLKELKKRGLLHDAAADGLAKERKHMLRRWKKKNDPLALCLEGMAASPARLVMVALEDLWGETRPQNVPGTVGAGNWSRRLAVPLEDWETCAPLAAGIAILNQSGRDAR